MAKLIDEKKLLTLKSKRMNLITGCFDLLHAGHIKFITTAHRHNPDIPLLVIILDDQNIALRKGPDRPIYTLEDRLLLLDAISDIDYLLPWHSHWKDLPVYITKLNIDTYFVNEFDPGFKQKQKIAKENKINIKTIPRYKDLSTTKIIDLIRQHA